MSHRALAALATSDSDSEVCVVSPYLNLATHEYSTRRSGRAHENVRMCQWHVTSDMKSAPLSALKRTGSCKLVWNLGACVLAFASDDI